MEVETCVGVGRAGSPASVVFGTNGNVVVTAELSGEMRLLSAESKEFPAVFSLLCWNDT